MEKSIKQGPEEFGFNGITHGHYLLISPPWARWPMMNLKAKEAQMHILFSLLELCVSKVDNNSKDTE
jgi:hypothetical protein